MKKEKPTVRSLIVLSAVDVTVEESRVPILARVRKNVLNGVADVDDAQRVTVESE